MKKLRYLVAVILSVSFLTTQSYAWGEREQAALLGGVGGIIIGSMIGGNSSNNDRRYEERRYYEERPVYVERTYYRDNHRMGVSPNWRPPVQGPRLYYIEDRRPSYNERYYYGR